MEGKRILVVDDEKDLVETIKNFLEERGCVVDIAYNGNSALDEALRLPDLILLDIKMPGPDGFEVLRRLRGDPATKAIPIIMLTSKQETESIFESQKLKATDYIVKPFSLNGLFGLMMRYLDEEKRRPVKI